jgi:hypothetical protein
VEAAADIPLVPRQAVGGMAILDRIELWGVCRELLEMEAGVGLLHRRDRRPLVRRAVIPQRDDMPSQLAPERPQKGGHVYGGELDRVMRHDA